MRKWVISGLIIFGLLSGCAIQKPVQLQTKFDYESHKAYIQNGTSVLKGQGFLRQQGGGVVTCAGSPVYLMPSTPFFREAVNLLRVGKNPQIGQKLDPAYNAVLKQSQCDAQGNFLFTNLPPGSWFVVTEVKWIVGYNQQGGGLLREVSTNNNEIQVLLTDNDLIGR